MCVHYGGRIGFLVSGVRSLGNLGVSEEGGGGDGGGGGGGGGGFWVKSRVLGLGGKTSSAT